MNTYRYPTRRAILGAGTLATTAAVASACTSPTAGQSDRQLLTLLLLGSDQQTMDQMNDVILPSFKEATGYDVEIRTSDWGSAFQRIITSAASNSLEDVLLIGGIWTAPLAAQNALADITERFASWDQADQFYDAMVADAEWEGTQYAVPFITDVRSGVYRQDMLEEAGVSELPETWEDFRLAAESIKDAGVSDAPIDWGIDQSIGLQQSFGQLYLQAGGQYFDADGNANFSSDAGVRALEYMVGTFTDGLADYNMVDSGSGPRFLVSGESAQCLTGTSVVFNAQSNNPDVVDHLVAGPALKADANSEPTPVAWVNKFAMSSQTSDPDAAWQLLTHLTGSEHLGDLSNAYGGLPPREDLADEDWIGPFADQVLQSAPEAISQPPDPRMLEIGPLITEELDPAIRGLSGVEETLASIDERINAIDG